MRHGKIRVGVLDLTDSAARLHLGDHANTASAPLQITPSDSILQRTVVSASLGALAFSSVDQQLYNQLSDAWEPIGARPSLVTTKGDSTITLTDNTPLTLSALGTASWQHRMPGFTWNSSTRVVSGVTLPSAEAGYWKWLVHVRFDQDSAATNDYLTIELLAGGSVIHTVRRLFPPAYVSGTSYIDMSAATVYAKASGSAAALQTRLTIELAAGGSRTLTQYDTSLVRIGGTDANAETSTYTPPTALDGP